MINPEAHRLYPNPLWFKTSEGNSNKELIDSIRAVVARDRGSFPELEKILNEMEGEQKCHISAK